MASNEILESVYSVSEELGTVLLETERLIVRRYLHSDAPAMGPAANYASIAANMRNRFPHPYELADAKRYLEIACKPDGTGYPQHNGIFLKPNTTANPSDTARLIGGMGVMPQSDVNYRTWEIGYWLTVPEWGKGYATEAARAFVQWLFETWPRLNRLEALTYSTNTASQNVLKKVGFIEEGRKRGSVEKNGIVLDEVVLGLLRSDCEQVAKA